MREILFRGKRLDNGEWVYGSYIQRWNGIMHRHYVCDDLYELEVDPKTVGQFTGLLDKNGKKIFEGDVVNHGYENDYGEFYDHYKVIYSNTNTCFVLESIYPCNPIKRLTKNNVKSQHTEVIGNIYDNFELLKES
jgi:uncharacterized phage protein (TIGR01671 family)